MRPKGRSKAVNLLALIYDEHHGPRLRKLKNIAHRFGQTCERRREFDRELLREHGNDLRRELGLRGDARHKAVGKRHLAAFQCLEDKLRFADSPASRYNGHAGAFSFFTQLKLSLECPDFVLSAEEFHDRYLSFSEITQNLNTVKLNLVKVLSKKGPNCDIQKNQMPPEEVIPRAAFC